jgi:hypothetical protein
MAINWKAHAKEAGHTILEVGALTGGMIVSKKFLDFENLFKNQIAKDPKFEDSWFMVHEGAVKLVVGVAAATFVKNPYAKFALVGLAVAGAIQEIRTVTSMHGSPFFDAIGAAQPDAELVEAARAFQTRGMNGYVNDAPTAVARISGFTNENPTGVAGMYNTDVEMGVAGPMMGKVTMGMNGCGVFM